MVVGGRGAGDVVDQAGLVAGKAIKPALTAHQFQGQANQPGAQHLGRTDHIDQGLQSAGRGQGAGGVEPTTEQPGQGAGLNGGRVVIATLHHRQGGFADGEHIVGLDQIAGVAAQHGFWVVEHAEQVGADWQHAAAVAVAPARRLGRYGRGLLQRHQHAIAAMEAAEGAVVDPENFQPEGVEQLV